jgi:hypothetical protein
MKESDQLATSFITPFGSYCYIMMSFGLKKASATYQSCMVNCFGKIIEETVEAYVDDIVVKSKKTDQLMADLEKTFDRLQANGIKLNLEKCFFGVSRGMLLGFIISECGIKANPKKVSAIAKMGPIQNLKRYSESQGAWQPLASLSRASANGFFPFSSS